MFRNVDDALFIERKTLLGVRSTAQISNRAKEMATQYLAIREALNDVEILVSAKQWEQIRFAVSECVTKNDGKSNSMDALQIATYIKVCGKKP